MTTGPAIEPADLRTAVNHEVHRYLSHDEVMPHVQLLIGHGGHATTMRALAHDLPVVIMPMHQMLDQPMVGAAVQRAGAGTVIPKHSSPQQVSAAITQFLAPGPHRRAAARIGREIRESNGVARAADEILAVTQPVPGR